MQNRQEMRAAGQYPFEIPVGGGAGIPAVRVVGGRPGKTLVVTAGVHGDEYVAVEAVRTLLRVLRPEPLAGQVIFVPVVNRGGFYAGTYLVPEDGENLNRCFPGDPAGSMTRRIAHALEQALYPQADFLLDLHSGSPYETMEPLVFFPVGAGEAVENAVRPAAQGLSLTYMVQSYARDGLYSWAAQRGIPAMLVERGGGGRWSAAEAEACRRNILETMAFLGICAGTPNAAAPLEICDAHYETAAEQGFWYCRKTAGEPFRAGELLGTVEDEAGAAVQALYAPFDGVVLYNTHALGAAPGLPLMAYGRPCAEPGGDKLPR